MSARSGDGDDRPAVIEPTAPRLRVSATVQRIEPPRPDEWVTGEHYFPDETAQTQLLTDRMAALDPHVQSVVRAAPVRPRGQLERLFRLIVAAGVLLCAVVFFWDALSSSLSRLVHRERWRAITVTITSASRARVFVQDKPRGWTPLSLVEYCRGRSIRVRVEAPGHSIWAWNGLCPHRGELRLDAHPQPLERNR